MSVMTIDAATYRLILADTYARYVRKGYSNAVAMQEAQQLMEGAFVCEDAVLQDELQRDHDENGIHG